MSLRDIERGSIREFLERESGRFDGARVLDYGCGAQPYRNLIEEAGGIYTGYDDPAHAGFVVHDDPASVTDDLFQGELWDVIVCTQVIQFAGPMTLFRGLRQLLTENGTLLLTGPTNWPLVEQDDLWRFTVTGVLRTLHDAGWRDCEADYRASVSFEGENWPIGWWAIGRKGE